MLRNFFQNKNKEILLHCRIKQCSIKDIEIIRKFISEIDIKSDDNILVELSGYMNKDTKISMNFHNINDIRSFFESSDK
jgi:hypothetical protein